MNMSTDRHRILESPVCKKSMRSDSLKRHKFNKHKNFNFQVTTIVKANVKDSGNPSVQDLESEILADNKLLDEKIELGEMISKVLTKTNAKEESLSKKKLLTCIKAKNLQLTQMMISNFILGSNKQSI